MSQTQGARAAVMKDLAKYLAGVLLAAALLWWVLRDTDAATLGEHLRSSSLAGLILCSLLMVLPNLFRVLRWRALLTPVRPRIPIRPLFVATILGYLVTWVIPGRLGELARPALLSSRERLPLAPCLGSVLADRVLDCVTILVLFAAGLWITPLTGQAAENAHFIRGASLGIVLVVSLPLFGLLAVSTARAQLEAWLSRRGGWVNWLGQTILSFSRGTEALKQPRLLLPVAIHSLLTWIVIAGVLWIGVLACGASIPFGAILILLPALALGTALPTPGGAGGFHAAMVYGLTELFSVPETVAISTAILVHICQVLPVILLGPVLLATEGVRFGDLLEAGRRAHGSLQKATQTNPTSSQGE